MWGVSSYSLNGGLRHPPLSLCPQKQPLPRPLTPIRIPTSISCANNPSLLLPTTTPHSLQYSHIRPNAHPQSIATREPPSIALPASSCLIFIGSVISAVRLHLRVDMGWGVGPWRVVLCKKRRAGERRDGMVRAGEGRAVVRHCGCG